VAARKKVDPTTTYARDVLAGRVVAGLSVRQACQRHMSDLEVGAERGLTFDLAAAQHALTFFGFLSLAEGEHAGKPFVLQPWQQFIIGSLFGWKGADGYRRFRSAYIEIGKGNGKSPLAAGIGLYGLVADGEAGAEIYSAAVTRDQAKILFSDAEKMVRASKFLDSRVQQNVNNLSVLSTNSYFRPVSSEARALDGKRVHIVLIDEVHEHPSSMVVDKMRAGTKGRRQPLVFEITNSGYNRESVCWHHHDYSSRVLNGAVPNDAWFAYVCQLDVCDRCHKAGKTMPTCERCDQWHDEAVWIKANPNIGVSITHKYLREQVTEAQGMPSKQNIVKRLSFCIWTEQANRWIDMDVWARCGVNGPIDRGALKGRTCYAGVDLSTTTDLTAKALLFPPMLPDEPYKLLWHFWIPEDSMQRRTDDERLMLTNWAQQGFITLTQGNVVDYTLIRASLSEDAEEFSLGEIGYDPWNATQLATDCQTDGLDVVPVRQGFATLSEPTKKFGEWLLSGNVDHGGNPVATWMAGNVSIASDPAGNIKPDKTTSSTRIDGIVAAIIAGSRAIVHGDPATSVYESRGVITF
jgi:phage terminase large subunit-like protein